MCSLCTRAALSVQGPLQTRRSSSQGDMHNHGRRDGWWGDETEGRRVKHHIHMVLYVVPLSGILKGVLVLGLIFLCCYTQRKQPQLCTSKTPSHSLAIPHRQAMVAHRAAPCATDRGRGGDDILLIKKPFRSSPQITVPWGEKKNDTRKRMFAATHGKIAIIKKDAAMCYWNCHMKHTVGEVSKQLSSDKKKIQNTSSMEMIDGLFTDKSQDFPYFQSLPAFCVRCLLTGCFVTWSRPRGDKIFKDLLYFG